MIDSEQPETAPEAEPSVRGSTRRNVLKAGTAAGLTMPAWPLQSATASRAPDIPQRTGVLANPITISPTINGQRKRLEIDVRTSLLDLLREKLGFAGAKKGCDHGQCGACTVHVDDRRVASCLTLAAKMDGADVRTIEGLSSGDTLHPMQQAFIDQDGLQCGYCTPGQIMAAIACVEEGHASSRDEIREYMSGNICRCGAYEGIVAAVDQAAGQMGRF